MAYPWALYGWRVFLILWNPKKFHQQFATAIHWPNRSLFCPLFGTFSWLSLLKIGTCTHNSPRCMVKKEPNQIPTIFLPPCLKVSNPEDKHIYPGSFTLTITFMRSRNLANSMWGKNVFFLGSFISFVPC